MNGFQKTFVGGLATVFLSMPNYSYSEPIDELTQIIEKDYSQKTIPDLIEETEKSIYIIFCSEMVKDPQTGNEIESWRVGGTGFVISPEGHLITNYHVTNNASNIMVGDNKGDYIDYEHIGDDVDADISLFKLAPVDHYLEFSPYDEIEKGEDILVLGHPKGVAYSVSKGIISRLGIGNPDKTSRGLVMTDAKIIPGNSGGPGIDLEGRVVGVANMMRVHGMGYMLDTRYVVRAVNGISIREFGYELLDPKLQGNLQ